jgi:phthiocerol/phenolphthiocerol synthesis type-I polyketide synthase E
VVVPGYPYQRRRFWVDRANTPAPAPAAAQPPGTQPSAAPPAVAAAAVPGPSSAAPDIADTGRRWRLARTQWIRAGSAASGPSTAMSIGPALLLATSVDARIRSVQSALQRAGYRTRVLVDAAGPGADRGTAIDPTDADQWMAQLGHRAARPGGERVLLVHATLLEAPAHVCAADLDSQLAAGVTAVHGTLRAAAALRRRLRTPVRLTVLGRGLVDVSGGESVNPASAAVLGLLRSAELEVPGLRCHLVDVGDRPAESALVEALAGEDPLVAVRGATRWLPRLETVTPTASSTPTAASTPTALVSPVRERGTYLITGGLGGIGLVLARALAESGARPHLVLLGRTGVGSRSDGDEVSRQLAALEEAGASVLTFACDVGDAAALAAVVDDVEKRIGPVNGVVHSAGLAGGGLLDRRTPADLSTVLAPKAAGVLALDEVFADRAPLDFLLLCSSLAGATGMYGNADYAAANSFLDAYSVSRSSTGRRTVSVQWPGWTEVGMLARSPEGLALLNGSYHPPSGTADGPAAVADPDAALEQTVVPGDWQFSEHVFDGVAVMPGTGLLQLLVRGVLAQSATWPVALRDVIFTAPLVADGRRRVRVRVLPQEGGRRVILDSRAEAAEGAWIEHATATWVEAIPDSGTDVDLAGLRARMPRERSRQPASWMDFGPRWQVTTDVCGDDRETLARLVLPERFRPDLPDHPLHPAMVDIAAGLVVGGPDGTVQAPFHYHRVVAHAPISADVQVYARMHAQQRSGQQAVDFDVFDTGSGRLLLHVESYLTRTVAPGAFAAAASHGAPATTLPSPNGHGGGPGAHPSDPDPVRDPTLSPDEGAEIFLHLLQVATPPVVLVDLLGVSEPAAAGDAVPDTVPDAGPSAEDAAVAARAADPTNGGRDIAGELHALWSSALGLTTIDPHADFFEIGGNSLAAVQLVNRISAHFGIELGAGSLFDQSTIDALAREIAKLLDAGV